MIDKIKNFVNKNWPIIELWIKRIWGLLIQISTLIALVVTIKALDVTVQQSKLAKESLDISLQQSKLAQQSLDESVKQSKLTEQSLSESIKQSKLTEESLQQSTEQSKSTEEQLKLIVKLTESSNIISNALIKDSMLKLADRAIGNDNDGGDSGSFDSLSGMTTEFKTGTDLQKFASDQWNRIFYEHKERIRHAESQFDNSVDQMPGWISRARDARYLSENKDGNQNEIRKQLANYAENDPSLAVRVIALKGFYKKCNKADSSGGVYNFKIIKDLRIPAGSKIPGTDQDFETSFICDM